MKIVVICEGKTEAAIKKGLREYVQSRLSDSDRVGIATKSLHGSVVRPKLATIVANHLESNDVTGVVVLTDVYDKFANAEEAKDAIQRVVGAAAEDRRFRAHVAKYDVEAWVIPFWERITRKLGVRAKPPSGKPEEINGQKPPSHHLKELYRKAKDSYEKDVDGPKWLTGEGLEFAAEQCPELRLFLNSLLEFAKAEPSK